MLIERGASMAWLQDELSSHFAQHVLNPKLWIMTAENLMSAAERLASDIEKFWTNLEALDNGSSLPVSAMDGSHYQNIFMMLQGFAIENLCKAYAVTRLCRRERLYLRMGRLPRRLKTHNLEYLVTKEIGLAADDHEKALLKRLEAAVKWAGRYPVSTGPMDQKKQEIIEQILAMPQGLRGDDLVRTRRLTERIKNQVHAKLDGGACQQL